MKSLLVYDTETTGFVHHELPLTAERQPHVLQFAYMVLDYDGSATPTIRLRGSMYLRLPDGAEIPEAATRVHGITHKIVGDEGVEPTLLLDLLDVLSNEAHVACGHNVGYDRLVLDVLAERNNRPTARWMDSRGVLDTMHLTRNILRIPQAKPWHREFKFPKLTEAHSQLCGFNIEDAHRADGDVLACVNVLHAVLTRGGTAANSILESPAGLAYPFYRR
ncbi:MAG: 3'-5' exonuclease [Planctomycetes bacterium]|nr:3'-5' exonuclease [Planctomycetota bacterium]